MQDNVDDFASAAFFRLSGAREIRRDEGWLASKSGYVERFLRAFRYRYTEPSLWQGGRWQAAHAYATGQDMSVNLTDIGQKRGYELRSGYSYGFRFGFFASKKAMRHIEGAALRVDADSERMAFVPWPVEITFRYGLETIELVPAATTVDVRTQVRFRGEREQPVDAAPKLQFPIVIKRPRGKLYMAYVLIAGLLFAALSSSGVATYAASVLPVEAATLTPWIRGIAVLLTIRSVYYLFDQFLRVPR